MASVLPGWRFAGLLLLLCGTLPGVAAEPPAAVETPITVETLLRGDRSWDGSLLPPYPAGQRRFRSCGSPCLPAAGSNPIATR